jgi:hypothetical protein
MLIRKIEYEESNRNGQNYSHILHYGVSDLMEGYCRKRMQSPSSSGSMVSNTVCAGEMDFVSDGFKLDGFRRLS